MAPVVLVMAGAARLGAELRALLGEDRASGVERLLLERAMRWGDALSAGQLVTAGIEEDVGDALNRVFAAHGDGPPVVVVWPVLPCWRPQHTEAVLDDLAAGCEASLAPAFDRGLYLLAMARPIPGVLELAGEAWDSPNAIGLVLTPINEADAPVGLVRPERALRSAGDVRAALADPLLDDELRRLLGG